MDVEVRGGLGRGGALELVRGRGGAQNPTAMHEDAHQQGGVDVP